jgi:hypothetical protein
VIEADKKRVIQVADLRDWLAEIDKEISSFSEAEFKLEEKMTKLQIRYKVYTTIGDQTSAKEINGQVAETRVNLEKTRSENQAKLSYLVNLQEYVKMELRSLGEGRGF